MCFDQVLSLDLDAARARDQRRDPYLRRDEGNPEELAYTWRLNLCRTFCWTVTLALFLGAIAFIAYCHFFHFLPLQSRLPPDISITAKMSAFITGKPPLPPPADEAKAAAVREMTAIAWHGYATHALGARALRPVSRSPSDEVTHYSTGLTVIEAMSTLQVMGLEKEYQQARQYVLKELKVPKLGQGGDPIYVWPLVTRYIGSLLSCYALTLDQELLEKAVAFGEAVRPAFKSKDRPFNRIDLNLSDTSPKMGFIGEMGAMTLELRYLADLTASKNSSISRNKTASLDWNSVLDNLRSQFSNPPAGLYPLTQETSFHVQARLASMSNDANHFFGYLVRSSLQTAGRDVKAMGMFDDALAVAQRHGVMKNGSGLVTVEDVDFVARTGDGIMKVGACQLGSTLALAGKVGLAEQLVESCLKLICKFIEGNNSSKTVNNSGNSTSEIVPHHLPAAEVNLRRPVGRDIDSRGVLSPEMAESYFTLWRLTKKKKWRARAWDLVQAINSTSRVGEKGFSEMANVLDHARNGNQATLTDYQPAEFLGGTLKFLYLTFSNFSTLSLDQWVFNAVGQPLPICNTNLAYPTC